MLHCMSFSYHTMQFPNIGTGGAAAGVGIISITKGHCGSFIAFHTAGSSGAAAGYFVSFIAFWHTTRCNSRISGQAVRQRRSFIAFHTAGCSGAAAGYFVSFIAFWHTTRCNRAAAEVIYSFSYRRGQFPNIGRQVGCVWSSGCTCC
jgi:hypothetical protein